MGELTAITAILKQGGPWTISAVLCLLYYFKDKQVSTIIEKAETQKQELYKLIMDMSGKQVQAMLETKHAIISLKELLQTFVSKWS